MYICKIQWLRFSTSILAALSRWQKEPSSLKKASFSSYSTSSVSSTATDYQHPRRAVLAWVVGPCGLVLKGLKDSTRRYANYAVVGSPNSLYHHWNWRPVKLHFLGQQLFTTTLGYIDKNWYRSSQKQTLKTWKRQVFYFFAQGKNLLRRKLVGTIHFKLSIQYKNCKILL